MDAQLKTKWLEALRSGKYSQGRIYLKEDNHYCCLGVLAECIRDDAFVTPVPGEISRLNLRGNTNARCTIPDEFYPFKELSDLNRFKLSSMNDNGKTFHEIADYIEKNIT